jgi:hypothetical protein
VLFSASYPRINPSFTVGKQIEVLKLSRGHRKTTIFTSIVHDSSDQKLETDDASPSVTDYITTISMLLTPPKTEVHN